MRQLPRNLAKDANIQDRTTGGVSKGWGRQPRAKPWSPQGCPLLPGSGSCIPKATPPLSPQFLLAGRQESEDIVLDSYPLGDELRRRLPLSGSQFPFSVIRFHPALLVLLLQTAWSLLTQTSQNTQPCLQVPLV